MAMIWPLVVVGIGLMAGLWVYGRQSSPSSYQTIARLHRVRQGLNLAHYKVEVRRETARVRRQLRAELERDEMP
jgi:hypothetical protein